MSESNESVEANINRHLQNIDTEEEETTASSIHESYRINDSDSDDDDDDIDNYGQSKDLLEVRRLQYVCFRHFVCTVNLTCAIHIFNLTHHDATPTAYINQCYRIM